MTQKKILVTGAGGFIGSHMVRQLKSEGFWIRGVDIKYPEFSESVADEFLISDLRDQNVYNLVFDGEIDEVYNFAADMGGCLRIFSKSWDYDIMHNSETINLNVVNACIKNKIKKIFFSSSACVYPEHNQLDPNNPNCEESTAFPANPDSPYGWGKLYMELLLDSAKRNCGLDIRIARYHNIMGPKGTYAGGREKAPAAMCRKVSECPNGGTIEVFGPGNQTRSFLYIDDCIFLTRRLMESNYCKPINIGSEEMISINDLAKMAIDISGKNITIKNIDGPVGVMGRCSQNDLMRKELKSEPKISLREGMEKTYKWIDGQVKKAKETNNE